MSKKYLIIILIVIALGIYLNLAYSHIYNFIGQAGLVSPNQVGTYVIGDNSLAKLTYVALGDSLTAGVGVNQYEESYPYLLAKNLTSEDTQVTLKSFAIPGFKTSDIISNFLDPAIASHPNIITLLIGVNDLHGNVSEADFQKNYEQILEALTAKTTAKIYLINLPQIGSNQLLWPPYNYYFRAKTKNFNQIIRDLAVKYKLNYIDLDTATADSLKNNSSAYSIDSFHPGVIGYKSWAQIIYDDFNK